MLPPAAEQREMKLVLVGNTCVGKTCVAKVATTGTFSEDSTPTLGASYVSKLVRLDDVEVRLQIWDTAGQERYRGMTPMYFRGAHSAILAYSIIDEDSFKSIDSWVTSLRENADATVQLFLVGNKVDLEEQRVVSTQAGETKAGQLSATFFEVSAKTGDRVEDLFIAIAKKYLEGVKGKDPASPPAGLRLVPTTEKKQSGCC
jgi:Ras-related protein Rab-5C